jgi:hypothetical protein
MAYAIETLTALPFGAVIGGPLKAAIEAQALAAKTTIDFIKAVGFEPPRASNEPDPFSIEPSPSPQEPQLGPVRNVTFTYQVERSDGTKQLATLSVPILTIVPIPYIRIDEMTIDFTAKIMEQQVQKQSSTDESTSASSSGGSGSLNIGFWWWGASSSFNYNASYSSKHSQSASTASKYQTEYTVNVHVRAVQDDLPAGLSRVLSILADGIKESRVLLQDHG